MKQMTSIALSLAALATSGTIAVASPTATSQTVESNASDTKKTSIRINLDALEQGAQAVKASSYDCDISPDL